MTLPISLYRRTFLLGITVGIIFLLIGPAFADEVFPSSPIKILVPHDPGGAADLHVRPLAPLMEEILKQPVVVVNKTGGGGTVGVQFVASSEADGYLILLAMPSFFIHEQVDILLGREPKFKIDQFVPIARLSADPLVFVVHPTRPWKSVSELVADAKRRPGEISYGSSGMYTGLHFPTEILAHAAGIKLKHVPYNGAGPAVTALLGGHVDGLASGAGPVLSHIRSGALRPLATWGSKRDPVLPDVPTLKEQGLDVEYYLQVNMVVRKETPPKALQVLQSAVREAVKNPKYQEALGKLGTTVNYLEADGCLDLWKKEVKVIAETLRRIQ